jgi:methylated-DNA-[protein]-cysteine S-methyltransferase
MSLSIANSPIGPVALELEEDGALVRVELLGLGAPIPADATPGDQAHRQAHRRVGAWLEGQLPELDLPFRLDGTPFQCAVWEALMAIPRGQTRTYGEVAAVIGRPASSRAVGAACGANSLPLLVPCHRVVASEGRLGGWSSKPGLKELLLELEGARTLSLSRAS